MGGVLQRPERVILLGIGSVLDTPVWTIAAWLQKTHP